MFNILHVLLHDDDDDDVDDILHGDVRVSAHEQFPLLELESLCELGISLPVS